MAIALLVTFEAVDEMGQSRTVSSQSLTFAAEQSAAKALEALKAAHMDSTVQVRGVILKDVII